MWNGKDGVFRTYAGLRISGEGLIPDHVTAQMRLEPTRVYMDGTRGTWIFSTKEKVNPLSPIEDHLRFVVDAAKNRRDVLKTLQAQFKTDISCYFASESDDGVFTLSADVLKEMGDLNLSIWFDGYFCKP